jgi:hypothetical protein
MLPIPTVVRASLTAAVLVVATTLAPPAVARAAAPTALLAEGPLDVIIDFKADGRRPAHEIKATLCYLYEDRLVYRDPADKNTKTQIKASTKQVVSVKSAASSLPFHWDLDEAKGVFAGAPMPVEEVDITPRPSTSVPQEYYLYDVVEGLYTPLITSCPNGADLAAVRAAAKDCAKYAEMNRLGHAEELKTLSALVPRLCDSWNAAQEKMHDAERRANSAKDAYVNLVRLRQVENAEGAFNDVGLSSDFSELPSVLTVYAVRQAQDEFKLNKELSDELGVEREAVTNALREFVVTYRAGLKLLHEEAAAFGHPSAEELESREKLLEQANTNLVALNKLYGATARKEPNNAQLQADACFWQAQAVATSGKRKGRAYEILAEAKKIATAVRLVPEGAVFDLTRLKVLREACSLACQAADAEAQGETWGEGDNCSAAYAQCS